MELKKKNQKLLIIVGVLLLFGGISLAYFVSKAILGGNGGSTSVTTAVIKGATLNVEGVLSFEDLDILPGHKTVSAIKVTATGNNELIPYNLIWQGTNTLTTPLNFTVYKTSEQLSVTSTCSKKTKIINGSQAISEECEISNIDKLGIEIASGTINKNETKVTLVKDEFITATSTGDIKYYYIKLEYPNLDEPQNEYLNGTFEGEVTVEESNIKPDINILAAYVVQDDGTYKQVEDIPQEGYQLNTEKSTCSNGTIPNWDTKTHTFSTSNLTKSGTSCYLYFDEYAITANESLIATNELINENGYRYEGSNPNNYIAFNNEIWRIIGIFETTKTDGTKDNLVKIMRNDSIGSIAWDSNKNNWSTSSLQQLLNSGDYYNRIGKYNTSGLLEESKKLIENVTWYLGGTSGSNNTTESFYNIERSEKVYDGNPSAWNGYVGLIYPSDYGYASPSNICNRTITLYNYKTSSNYNCTNNNWILKIDNISTHWTILPYSSSNNEVFTISNAGIGSVGVFGGCIVNPTVYLKSSVRIIDGNGTESNPYIISN